MATVAIILAAGAGKRMGADRPKQFLDLGGRSLILYALDAFEACSAVDRIVLVTPPDMIDEVRTLASVCEKVQDVVAGGAERQDSVAEGIKAVGDAEIIAVHDGARPMVRAEEIADVIEAARANGAAVIGQPASDTIKRGRDGQVIETLDRSEVWAVQTPQAFKADVIREAHEAAARDGFYGTDDTALVERIGKPVTLVEGSRDNIKVTHPGDLERAEDILNRRMEGGVQRIGMGYDVHQLAEGRKLILGGVEVPFERGLDGHSDADVLSHVVIDALLGAASLGDIGRLFPDTDAAYKDISSLVLLERTAEALREANVTVGNVDATVMAQRPKLAPHIGQMEANIAEVLGIDVSQVSVKATTTEKLGFVGEEKGMAAQAIALVRQSAKGKMENENRGGAE
ncbi:TPA: bifunctional 2-C-methyl-D-erythritol 4-phosphate cytidylyltransferase/2-C-methyl-D-erythritol 2,4-cyclodiphosphate synthase [Candidatus Latescibacteria bacterium]|nr:bifunctional 2-C-methyl-D-erythritol 4-phosphate cytidylyltransferase/2-C-methyl-D-erythritol 2,4-cyclodiphosphate synthase [Candidatus Latescibacterota bacterium]